MLFEHRSPSLRRASERAPSYFTSPPNMMRAWRGGTLDKQSLERRFGSSNSIQPSMICLLMLTLRSEGGVIGRC